MEKRVFLAIFLSFLVLITFQYFMPTPATPASTTTPAATSSAAGPGPTALNPAAPSSGGVPGSTATPSSVSHVPTVAAIVADTEAHDITVDTDAIHVVFSTRGAVVTSWKLKHYPEEVEKKAGDAPSPIELVPPDLPAEFVKPFTLETDDPALSATLKSALYRPSTDHLTLGGPSVAGTLTFEYQDASGLTARKTFLFQPDNHMYMVRVDASIDVAGVARPVILDWGPAVGLGYSATGSRYMYPPNALQMRDGNMERPSASDLGKQSQYDGNMRFAGVADQYFLSAVLPDGQVHMAYQPLTLPVPADVLAEDAKDDQGPVSLWEQMRELVGMGSRQKAPATRTLVGYSVRVPSSASLTFYLGPKDFDLLKSIDPQLVRAIDFGWLSWVVVPLLQALKGINRYVGNYGVSIIVLTLLINVLLFPLRHRSMVSMRKMQTLQPKVKAIQDRYKNLKFSDPDKQKMNAEMMALYKENGANPASGCVPMLLTFPILFAFYRMLVNSIELRGAPFFGWIHNLAAHDPYYITPILMGATMFWQQRTMPSTGDAAQQKMMMFMPLIFVFTFLWLPSGVVLYYLAQNLIGIGQQKFTNRLIGAPAIRPASTASERRVKRLSDINKQE